MSYLSSAQRLHFATVLCLLALTILLASCGAQMRPMPTDSDLAVARQMSPEGNFQCTAWKVGEQYVMTAGHCCEDNTSYTMAGDHGVPGEEYSTLVNDDVHDVCVLSGHLEGKSIKIAKRDPLLGEGVWTEGWPRGIFLISSGYWSGRDEDLKMGITSSTVGFGSSGSPVLDGNNNAVGLISARYLDMDNLTIVVTVEWMRRALEKAQLLN